MAEPLRAQDATSIAKDERIDTKNRPPAHAVVLDFWARTTARLQNRSRRILMCRQMRRGLLRIPLPPEWMADEKSKALREWAETALPERKMLDLNLVNVLGEQQPELSRVPLGTTDTAIEDANQLETWIQSATDASYDRDAVLGQLGQDGEMAVLVVPTRAGPETPPQYMVPDESKRKGSVAPLTPDPQYDRDKGARAPDSKNARTGESNYQGRDEAKSQRAYTEHLHRWLAEHPSWYVRLVDALDCAPIMVRGRGPEIWEPRGLLIRTLYDREELINQGFQWKSMGDTLLIPSDYDRGRVYGNMGQIYLYELYLMVECRCGGKDDNGRPKGRHQKPICVYSVGGDATTEQYRDAASGDLNERATIIDYEAEFGQEKRFWHYDYGMHLRDTPDWMGVPFIEPLLRTMMNHEMTRSAIRAAIWDLSFTGHVEEVNPNLPRETIIEGFKRGLTKKPAPGQTVKAMGKVSPYAQAQVGADAWRMLEYDRRELDLNSPDQGATGAGDTSDRSGHALLVSEKLLKSGKRQIGNAMLRIEEFVAEHILRIAIAGMKGAGGQPKVPAPVFVTTEEQLDDGSVEEQTSVLLLEERWVGGMYKLAAEFPAEGNLAEIDLMRSLAKDGFATDEDVDKARGIKNTLLAQVKRAIYRWRMSPEGQMEIDMRAAAYQGNEARLKLLELVAQQRATPSGGPTAAIDPNAPGTAALGAPQAGAPPSDMPGGSGGPSMVSRQRAGTEGGQMRSAAMANDARTLAQVG